eukprot:CAMPEP_0197521712 /NCGR_PEP_ID=MMETSP1318-20131121/6959_1 /TAXON_ID=552666 /ORGANISM="Partenskyella glossopodia, Strain RCC365" /LENGTH=296 /DNA_ID=CAMNT_0043073817 /DNA_START=80 /DNA_END=967 /DNA_ORIENTATION=+
MSNIHGIGSFRDNAPSAGGGPQQGAGGYRGAAGYPQGGGGFSQMVDEGEIPAGHISLLKVGGGAFPDLCDLFCPRFRILCFTTFISVVQVIMLIVCMIVGATMFNGAFVKGNDLGGPGPQTFLFMGAKYLPYIQAGQVYRFVTPIFLHGGILHLASNLFFQCRIGFIFELRWGLANYIAVYFLTGIGATYFSCLLSPASISVGASGALFGLIGADLAYLIMNWRALPNSEKYQELCIVLCILLINFLFGMTGGGDGNIDNSAHFGGLVFGFLIGFALTNLLQAEDPMTTKWRIGGW